jgi:succinyl-CoA synthetase beta subunit
VNLHEHQAKRLFAGYRIPVPLGITAETAEQARQAAQELGGQRWVVKAQAHTGGRGKAGGVVVADTLEQVQQSAEQMLSQPIITQQTGPAGLPVSSILVEEPCAIATELYLSALIDRETQRILLMASQAGGMNIEEVAATTPEQILTLTVDPSAGLQPYQCRRLGFALGLAGAQIKSLQKILFSLVELVQREDASLVEINPLIVTATGDLLALDAKINLDSNAAYRHKDWQTLRDLSQEDAREAQAAQHDLNYITLDGNIGCMVNGAGLAMATLDLVKLQGGAPANFLDVGGGTTTERVAAAFKLILSDKKVAAILVNIFGGIVRCDLIADGILSAAQQVGMPVPVVVRLAGTRAAEGLARLEASDLPVTTAADLTAAAKQVVAAAGGEV